MRYTGLLLIFVLIMCGCKKDKFTSAPQLKYRSANTKVLHRGETLQMTLSFTDAEGDLTDSLIVSKTVAKCRDNSNSSFVQPYKIPSFPTSKNQTGDIVVSFTYNEVNPVCPSRNDTAIFRFVLKDKAQNKSDTAVSDPIAIIY